MTEVLVTRLLEELDRAWQPELRSTIHALASMGPSVVTPLVRAIEQGSAELGRHSALVLQEMKAREALPSLLEILLEDKLPRENRLSLIEVVISLMEEDQPVPHMLEFLLRLSRELDAELRRLAASGLGKVHSPEVAPVLERLSRDMVAMVSAEARVQLAQFPESFDEEPKIPELNLSMLAAAARLQSRTPSSNGGGGKARDEGSGMSASELLPRLRDAGPRTLEEVTPLLRSLDCREANGPLVEILLDEKNSLPRRLVALESLYEINEDLTPLEKSLDILRLDSSPHLRIAALQGLKRVNFGELSTRLGEALSDEDARVQREAASLLVRTIQPSDKSCLRSILSVVHAFPEGGGRLDLLRALLRLLDGTGSNPFLLSEMQELLEVVEKSELPVLLDIIEELVGGKPHPILSRQLLGLLKTHTGESFCGAILDLLLRVMPRNFEEASECLCDASKRLSKMEEKKKALSLLGRIADQRAVDLLILLAHSQQEQENVEELREYACSVLDDLEGSLREVWRESDGIYRQRPGLPCLCGSRLEWIQKEHIEELRCVECEREYVLAAAFLPIPIEEAKAPLCFCPECSRKQMLTRMSEGFFYCFHSGRSYTVRSDNQQLILTSSLEYGICRCCQPPQPMERRGERIVCSHTGKSLEEIQQEEKSNLPPIETGESPVFHGDGTGGNGVRHATPSSPVRSFRLRRNLLSKHVEAEND